MACYSPNVAIKGDYKDNGKRELIWRYRSGGEKLFLPCGKCIGCKLSYAKGWAIRCMHEASLYDQNSFVTLTFDNEHLPKDGNLDVRTFQDFIRRLRKTGRKNVRYFHAGEYGGNFGRPHYHAILFNVGFEDKELKFTTDAGSNMYVSKELQSLWPYGLHSIGDVTYASAAYVARYCVKKATEIFKTEIIRDEDTGKRYWINKKTGEMKVPEYTTMSRRPGIGSAWYDKYKGDIFPGDYVIVEGRKEKVPRFYENKLDKEDPDLLESLKLERANRVSVEESTLDRLIVKEEVQLAKNKIYKRSEI